MLLVGLKRLLAAWKAARKRGENENEEDESEWRAKKTAVSRKIMPADGSKNTHNDLREFAEPLHFFALSPVST